MVMKLLINLMTWCTIFFILVLSGCTTAPPAKPKVSEIIRDGTFIKYSNGLAKDTDTGLEWVVGPDRDTTWSEARDWVEGLKIDGGSWRLPTLKELKTLYKKGTHTRNMNPVLKTTGWWVWSSELEGSSFVWLFDFTNGSKFWDLRSISIDTRAFAVRPSSDR